MHSESLEDQECAIVDEFNPYREWLGLDAKISSPSLYQLLGLENFEPDLEKIHSAADRAQSRVRSHKPGAQAGKWAALLDELANAKRCLTNTSEKAAYDQSLRNHAQQKSTVANSTPGNSGGTSAITFQDAQTSNRSNMYPPGFQPVAASTAMPSSAANPPISAAPVIHQAAPQAFNAPTPQPWNGQSPTPFAPYPSAAVPPAQPASFPPYNPMDPMAPTPQMGMNAPTPSSPMAPSAMMPSLPNPMDPAMAPAAMYPGAAPNPMSPMSYGSNVMPSGYPPNPMAQMPQAPMPAMGYPQNSPMTPMMPATGFANPHAMPEMPHPVGSAPVMLGQPIANPAAMPVMMGMPVGTAMPQHQPMPSMLAPMPVPVAGQQHGTPFAQEAEPVVRAPSTTTMVRAQRSQQRVQTLLIMFVAVGLMAITGAAVFYSVSIKQKPVEEEEIAEAPIAPLDVKPKSPRVTGPLSPENAPKDSPPDMPSEPSPPKPTPTPTPPTNQPTTTPNPPVPEKPVTPPTTPTPSPNPPTPPKPEPPKPEPVKPEPPKPVTPPTPPMPPPPPAVMPKPAEVKALAIALKDMRVALSEFNVEDAAKALQRVEKMTMLPEHADKYERAKQLVHYEKEFRDSLREATKGFEAGASIPVGNTMVSIVETFKNEDRIIVRIAGENRRFQFADLPVGLAVALANQWLDKNAASSHLVKAVYVTMHKRSNDDMKAKAREWLDEAKKQLPEIVAEISKAFEDTYDLEKDLPTS